MSGLVAIALLAIGGLVAALSVRALGERRRDRRLGALVAIDAGRPAVLRSERYRIVGRPDVLRQDRHGRTIPVEIKRRAAPRDGPFRSHKIQLWTYCLLVEEETGAAPTFGVLRYSDREFRVRWDAEARAELFAVREAALRPYEGEATPSEGRCRSCTWSEICDARVR